MTSFPRQTHRTRIWKMMALAALTLLCARSAKADDIVPGHVLVKIRQGVDINTLAANYGSTVLEHISILTLDVYSLKTPNGTTETAFVNQLTADTQRVDFAEPDRKLVSPEVEGSPFHLAFDRSTRPQTYANSASYVQINTGSLTVPNRRAQSALATGQGTVVAVLDSGATFDHPDLRRVYLSGYNVLAPGLPPIDAPDGVTNAEWGHGTMIAGIIARLAPMAKILPVRVINGDGVGTILGLARGIRYAYNQGVDVINISLSCSVNCGTLNNALDDCETGGVLVVSAAGNMNSRRANPPADGQGVLSVGSVESDNRKSPYSNYKFVKVVAPGSNVRSTHPEGYATWSGTSFAAPFVAAQAALIMSVRPTLTAEAVKEIIRDTARDIDNVNPNYRGDLGKGLVDITASLRAVSR